MKKEGVVPIGLESVDMRTPGPGKKSGLRFVAANCTFVRPGATFIVPIDGHPIIVATATAGMVLGHARTAVDIVGEIVRVFQKHGTHAGEVAMCVQFATSELESECIDRAIALGLQYVWAMNAIGPPRAPYEYVAFHRRGRCH